jgi:hypothetical protein
MGDCQSRQCCVRIRRAEDFLSTAKVIRRSSIRNAHPSSPGSTRGKPYRLAARAARTPIVGADESQSSQPASSTHRDTSNSLALDITHALSLPLRKSRSMRTTRAISPSRAPLRVVYKLAPPRRPNHAGSRTLSLPSPTCCRHIAL